MSGRAPSACIFILLAFLTSACTVANQTAREIQNPIENLPGGCEPAPTPKGPLAELIHDLRSDDACLRLSAALAIAEIGENASLAVPALTTNLYYNGPWEIRASAAYALGQIGPASKPAVPVLIAALLADFMHVRSAAATALGTIGDASAVPALAVALQDDHSQMAIYAAEALAILTGQEFPGLGGPGYELNDEGVPFIVVAAQQWWTQEGLQQSWITP